MARPQRQLLRVLDLIRLLANHPGRAWTWAELAAELSVTTRTVRRDVEALSQSGAKWTSVQIGNQPARRVFKGWMPGRGL